ncbi:hypothetical protein [Candidatus Magnetominusculus xianensis]|uniref:hypothetical protein n=1 Tax=Candidatus Magnetominusculus xianensis TaxID=1748249 RepID=UPI0012EE56B4|nr:hypothetical protein [Candidatus Magnetominusculus xianensis]
MKVSTTINAGRPILSLGDLVGVSVEGEASDTLFLESLVAEANRTLESLHAINLLVEGQQEKTSVRVAYRETRQEIGRISADDIPDLANRVRQLKGMLLDTAGEA